MLRFRILALLLPGLALLAACGEVPPPTAPGPSQVPLPSSGAQPSSDAQPAAVEFTTPVKDRQAHTPEPPAFAALATSLALASATTTPMPVQPSDVELLPALSTTEQVPPPADPFPLPSGVEVLVLLGMDAEDSGVGRTDTILLVFYNLQYGSASLVSVPRDLYVYLPGIEMNRINTAFFKGGFELLALTFEYNLGVRPAHWAAANFNDFVRFIDELGGITVNVSDPMPGDCGGIPPGKVHMDGAMALCYLRERRTTSDIARSRRQQEVLQEILERVIALESLRYLPEWYERYRGSVMTDLGPPDLFAFIPLVLKLPDSGLEKYQISWDEVEVWKVPDTEAQVFLPQRERITALLHRAVSGLSSSAVDSPAYEKRIAALTATATLPAQPGDQSPPEPLDPMETPAPTMQPAPTDPSP